MTRLCFHSSSSYGIGFDGLSCFIRLIEENPAAQSPCILEREDYRQNEEVSSLTGRFNMESDQLVAASEEIEEA